MKLEPSVKNKIARILSSNSKVVSVSDTEVADALIYYYTAKNFGWTPEQTDRVPMKMLFMFMTIDEVMTDIQEAKMRVMSNAR